MAKILIYSIYSLVLKEVSKVGLVSIYVHQSKSKIAVLFSSYLWILIWFKSTTVWVSIIIIHIQGLAWQKIDKPLTFPSRVLVFFRMEGSKHLCS